MVANASSLKPYEVNAWLVLRLPNDVSNALPSRGQVMVKGELNGVPFHKPVEPDGKGGHWLHIDTVLQRQAGAKSGENVSLQLEATKDWPEPSIPDDVLAALHKDSVAFATWQKTTPMARWEWLRWIGSTAQVDTRKRRIEVAGDKLRKGMRRPCCFNRNMCCVPEVAKNGILLDASINQVA